MNDFVSGLIVMGYAVVGLFFWRFWRDTRDRLFAIFAASFWVLGAQRVAVLATGDQSEHQALLYGVRLAAYVLILIAIVDKNRTAAGER